MKSNSITADPEALSTGQCATRGRSTVADSTPLGLDIFVCGIQALDRQTLSLATRGHHSEYVSEETKIVYGLTGHPL